MSDVPDSDLIEITQAPKDNGQFKPGNKLARGPKSGYRPKYANVAKDACARGLTDFEIAEMLDISESTLLRWKGKYPAFGEAFRLGKRLAHDRVERALYSKAVGYQYTTQRVVAGHKVTLKQTMPPDTAAAVFYLKNRRPQKWKDVQRYENGPAGAFDQIDDAVELRKRLTQMALDLGLIVPSEVKVIEGKAVDITEDEPSTLSQPEGQSEPFETS